MSDTEQDLADIVKHLSLLDLQDSSLQEKIERVRQACSKMCRRSTSSDDTRYSSYSDHPLRDVPQEILDAAREEIAGAVEWKDIDPDMADPLADAVVIALLPWLHWDDDELQAENDSDAPIMRCCGGRRHHDAYCPIFGADSDSEELQAAIKRHPSGGGRS